MIGSFRYSIPELRVCPGMVEWVLNIMGAPGRTRLFCGLVIVLLRKGAGPRGTTAAGEKGCVCAKAGRCGRINEPDEAEEAAAADWSEAAAKA